PRLEPRPRRPARTRSSGPATRRCPRARRRRISTRSPTRPTGELAHPLTVELAEGVHRELTDEDDAPGTLVRGEPRSRVRDQIDVVRRAARLGDDERDDLLAPALRGHPDHRGRAHPGEGLERELHLARVDVEATGDDDLLGPAGDREGPVAGIDATDVTRPEPPTRVERGGGLGVVGVAGEPPR